MLSVKKEQLDSTDWKYWRDSTNYQEGLPQFKRGIERWVNDFRFRSEFELDSIRALQNRGFDFDVLSLEVMVDNDKAKLYPYSNDDTPILVKEYRDFIVAKKKHCIQIRDSHPKHPLWGQWRKRMIGATLWKDGPKKHAKLVHAPFAIELTDGCSVGCWFCGVDSKKYNGHLEINAKTEAMWRRLLETFRSTCGAESAQHGFCYWATDPFDHPEYEWFLEEFHTILGYWPQTTTAQVMKHADRMRKLLNHIQKRNAFVQRFSMVRSGDFNAIHDFFTPEELFMCELIPQFDDRLSPKATAGRVRSLVKKRQDDNKDIPFHYNLGATGSIACVSGFLVNLVDQSLKLIAPCDASDRWPLGYRLLGEGRFESVMEIEPLILSMLDKYINSTLIADDILVPHREIEFTCPDDSSLAITKFGYTLTLRNLSKPEEFAELLKNAPITVGDVCSERSRSGIDNVYTSITLNQLFDHGIFDEEPIDNARLNK